MSFAFPYLFRNSVKKKREHNAHQHSQLSSTSLGVVGCNHGSNNVGSQHNNNTSIEHSSNNNNREQQQQPYPTLISMVQAKAGTSPNPSPSSSTSSRSRPASIAHPPTIALEPEELEHNRFYRYIRSHFNLIFSRSSVVCVPHSRSLEGLILTKDFIETHSYNPSPYYREQYQAANGKVIAIELPIISTVSGFKEPRTLNIMAEEWVYIARKKIRVLMIERPLEGEAPLQQQPRSPNTISITTTRNSKTDLDFLNMFPENAEAMQELQLTVQKFVETYVYIRGFNAYTVEKIQHMYIKAYQTILQRNKLLRDACRLQTEHDHFLELVENVVMGFLHEKIWVQSLRSILHSQDNYLESICNTYAKESITLNRYSVSHPMADMQLECFEAAITCLRRVDTDSAPPISVSIDEEKPSRAFPGASDHLAFTPLEKLACIRTTLDLITEAVTNYIQSISVNMTTPDDSPVTADEMIPLFAYILVHSRISRIASLVFYMEHFRLSHIERSEHSFALVTLKAATDFLKVDPLSLHDASSGMSTLSANSTSSALSPQIPSFRGRSTSFSSASQIPANNVPHTPSHYRSVSMSSQPSSIAPVIAANKQQQHQQPHTLTAPSSRLRHRKSHSADLHHLATEIQDQYEDQYGSGGSNINSRRSSLTPSVLVRPPIVLPTPREMNRRSLDITNDWMLTNSGKSATYSHHHQQYYPGTGRPASFGTLHGSNNSNNNVGHSRPIISTTFPTISNSSPLPGLCTSPSITNNSRPSSPQTTGSVKSFDHNTTNDTRRLERSLSSASSLFSKKLNHPPEIINIRNKYEGLRRPASICIDPRSMHRNDEDDLMGDFLRGLQSLDGDIVGERTGSYRTVRRL